MLVVDQTSPLANLSYVERLTIDTNKTIPCPYGIYYSNINGQSLAEKYNRGCDNGKIVSSLWQSSSTFGRIVGYIFMGILADWIGRKTVLFISTIVAPIAAITVAFSTHHIVFIVTSVIHGFFDGGFAVCLLLIMEISTNPRRSEFLLIGCCSLGLGIEKARRRRRIKKKTSHHFVSPLGLLPAINRLFKSYDLMLITINSLFLLLLVFIKIIPESPSWLFSTRNLSRLNKLIRKASQINQIPIQSCLHLTYKDNHIATSIKLMRLQVWHMLVQPEIACEIIGITYLTGLFALIFGSSYYSILAHVTDSKLASTLLATATIAGMLCGQICLLLMGHKKILQIALFLVLVSSFMLIIDLHDLRPSNTGPTTTLLLLNVSIVSLSYGVLLNYSARTLPTLLRGTLCGIWRAIWALFVWTGNHDYVKFPNLSVTLIMTCVLAGLFSLNLKDLYHRELPDTIDDSIHFKM